MDGFLERFGLNWGPKFWSIFPTWGSWAHSNLLASPKSPSTSFLDCFWKQFAWIWESNFSIIRTLVLPISWLAASKLAWATFCCFHCVGNRKADCWWLLGFYAWLMFSLASNVLDWRRTTANVFVCPTPMLREVIKGVADEVCISRWKKPAVQKIEWWLECWWWTETSSDWAIDSSKDRERN